MKIFQLTMTLTEIANLKLTRLNGVQTKTYITLEDMIGAVRTGEPNGMPVM